MAAKIEPLLTIEDLEACPDDGNRYELIGGESQMRFSRAQIIGALMLLAVIWIVIAYRLIFARA